MRIEFLENWGTCIRLRGLMDGNTIAAWMRRIREARPDELRQIAAELIELTGYSGKMRYRSLLTQAGQEQAKIFLEETLKALFEKDFVLPWQTFEFPYPNDADAAKRVVEGAGREISDLYKQNRRAVLKERKEVLNMALSNRFSHEVSELYRGQWQETDARKLYDKKIKTLPVGIQNIFLLKCLEMVEIERGPIDSLERAFGGEGRLTERQKRTKSRLEEMVWSVLKYLPAERLAELSPERAKAAMFFLFRFGEYELNASQSSYVLYFVANHPTPDELVSEYLSLNAKGTHNTFALRDVTPANQFHLRSPDSRGWVYEDRLVVEAIEKGQVTSFEDIIGLGRQGYFFDQETGPHFSYCYRPPQ